MVDSCVDPRKCLPKNLSYEGKVYTHKYYYPKVAASKIGRAKLKMDPVSGETKIAATEDHGPISESLDEGRQRSMSGQSDSDTNFSEDYTQMTDVGEGSDLEFRSPSDVDLSVNSDEFSDRSSISTLENDTCNEDTSGARDKDDEDDEDDVLITSTFAHLDIDGVKHARQRPLDIDLTASQAALREPIPSPDDDDDEDEENLKYSFDMGEQDLDEGWNPESGFFEDREFDFLKTERVKRSSSLKTYKTPPGTPSRKKAVRFADALGLDLESVRHILNLDSPPKIPDSAVKDLRVLDDLPHTYTRQEGNRYLTACFTQPGAAQDFYQRVADQKVVLENCLVSDRNMTITGTARVWNVSYHKQVMVRYSVNNWLTFDEMNAGYVQNSWDGANTDRFSFTITVPHYFNVGSRLEFALVYVSGGGTFWDNNHGENYVVQCYASAMPAHESDNTWMHFL